MDKLKMQTTNKADENFRALAAMFPNAVTEIIDENGEVVRAIDKDVLMQEISVKVVEGKEERYQFTWPDKKKAMLAANAPISATLRPVVADSVGRDGTPGGFDSENLYIEGDNLEVLKLLQETYLGKVKMIYIDPPYNTGNDFVYEDDFAQSTDEYMENSGQYDEEGNRMVLNTESNGRFHTDWLNMMYPRLKLAKDLLAEDGVIFISIDDNEQENLRKICDEIFGADNYRNTILVRRRIKSLNSQFTNSGLYSMNVGFEYVMIYGKSSSFLMKALRMKKENASTRGRWDVFWSNADRPTMRYDVLGFTPTTGQWRNSKEKTDIAIENYKKYQEEFESTMTLEEYYKKTGISDFIRRIPNGTGKNGGVQHWVPPSGTMLRTSNWTDIEVSQIGKEIDIPFDNPKSKNLLIELVRLLDNKEALILDFFSGSATTAHAVMQLNAEDGGHRKFIMVQLPEKTDEKSEAYKAGYENICEIGKERIRRAGRKIKEEAGLAVPADLDIGFRCLRLSESNMENVYYAPEDTKQEDLFHLVDNVKPDRTPEDLLFQVMLDLGVLLSSSIEVKEMAGKKVFNVAEGFLLACFDHDVTEETVKAIAQRKPCYAVFRDSSMANDSVAANFDQIFETYSPETVRKVL
ncbi:MAG: site-specific DNA-methyltransferase [Dialister invisus]|uniref:site-specific DNA-methyltransferase n=1 Tax=Dialister invisus TaxID=218538 RepID=UPI00399647E7